MRHNDDILIECVNLMSSMIEGIPPGFWSTADKTVYQSLEMYVDLLEGETE